jgi:GTPase
MTEQRAGTAHTGPERLSALLPATEGEVPAGHRSGFVTLCGRSNVGKSTLLNRLVGQKVAIVTEVPQTTRRRIRGIRTWPDAQVIFVDTPGIHKPRYTLNRRMVQAAIAALDGADLLLPIIDGAAGLGPGDRFVMDLVRNRQAPVFLIINKTDLMQKEAILRVISEATQDHTFEEVVPVSAATGENIDRLIDLIRGVIPEGPRFFPADAPTDTPEKQVVAELLREKIILNTREELPHSTAVIIDRFGERPDGLVDIDALIVVERDSQKGILIGQKGETMKRIASEARRDMEAFLGVKVFLQVWVKVAKDWRMDDRFLDRLGVDDVQEQEAIEPPGR